MTGIPAKITKRRAVLESWAEHHREEIEFHRRALDRVVAAAEAIDFCIAAYADTAPNAEAVEGERDVAATPGTPGAENALAGTSEGLNAIEPKTPAHRPACG